jgi:DNA-binding NarL/FixJ family response regulator
VTGLPTPHRKFSPRQHELLDLLAGGASLKGAARAMGISPRTAYAYVEAIAQRIPNPDGRTPLRLVLEYVVVRRYVTQEDVS